jgi:hypothetical protein
MKANLVKILWGIVLIASGGVFLADTLGYVDLAIITRQAWSIIFATFSVAFFACYLLVGVRKWGWLFPALIFAALALILGVFIDNHSDSLIAVSILLSVGVPFYVGYLLDHKDWGLLIPAWIMTVVSAIVVLSESANSDLIGSLFLFAIALPFLTVYLFNRQRKWAFIVGAVVAVIGFFPLIGSMIPADISGPVVMFLFALTFSMVYFVFKKQWWALIPSGIFASIGLVALLDLLFPNQAYFTLGEIEFSVYTSVLFLGFAATFGILWLLRGSQPTAWAKYPALGLLALSIVAFLMWKTASNLVIAAALMTIGVLMIIGSVLKRRDPHQLTSGHI